MVFLPILFEKQWLRPRFLGQEFLFGGFVGTPHTTDYVQRTAPMNMQVMMGIVIALGFGAAIFLVSNGFEDPKVETTDVVESEKDATKDEGLDEQLQPNESNEAKFEKIEASIQAHPQDRQRAYKYAVALVGLEEFERAEKFLIEQVDLFPKDAKIIYCLGWCYEQQKKWAQAIDVYSNAIFVDRNHRESKNNLAWILSTVPDKKLRNGARAVALATQAVGNEHPPNPQLMDTLAAAYAEVGAFGNAVKIQRYVSRKTEGDNAGVEKRLQLYLKRKPYRLPE